MIAEPVIKNSIYLKNEINSKIIDVQKENQKIVQYDEKNQVATTKII